MKKLILIVSVMLLGAVFALFFTGCDSGSGNDDASQSINIVLSDDEVEISGDGAEFESRQLTITQPGVYNISGSLSNGRIVVDVARDERVELVMTDVSITSAQSAVLHVIDAERVFLTIPEGSTTTFTDAERYVFAPGANGRPHSAIYSRRSITIRGGGTLNVNGNFHNGIWSRGSVRIQNSTVNVTAPNNGIRGRNSVRITNSTFDINAGNHGIRVTRENDPDRGFVLIEDSSGNIRAGDDGIRVITDVNIRGSNVTISARGWFIMNQGEQNIEEGNVVFN